jgi:ornithine cyclodeaminase/alanine dehydrogenase-like protein (mu-crystallin family)
VIVSLPEIQAAFDPVRARRAIADGFVAYSQGAAVVPPVGELLFTQPPGDVHIKYGYIHGSAHFVIKVATGFYDNPKQGLPANDGVMLVHAQHTGVLVAVLLDRGWLTGVRTALAGAIVAQHLAPKRISCIGVLGTGEQARLQVIYLRDVVNCERILVCGRSRESMDAYQRDMAPRGYDVRCSADPAALASCELIITATPAAQPLLDRVERGSHITAVGTDSANKNEISPEVFGQADIVVADSIRQCSERGSLRYALQANAVAASNVIELGDLLAGRHPGRQSASDISIADLTGVAVQDIKVAEAVLESLQENRA